MKYWSCCPISHNQSELSGALFPYLLEQFSVKDYQDDILDNADEITIDVSPLLITVINIDGIAYDSNAVGFLQTQMAEKATDLKNKLCVELTSNINAQYDICISNIDSYLD
jgi:hypothetical protein